MNKKELSEIRKNFNDNSGFFTLNRVLTAYIDPQKNILCKENKLYALIPEDEGIVIMEVLKKVFSGSLAKNLVEYSFPNAEYNEGGALNILYSVVNSKLHHAPTEPFESERRFCVYDDIKQKLVSKGVPEKEIAFIHDADKAEDKQKLYDKMNKGEIRVLIGSTSKCGAGMNAQERMIALHDLDAPMRPSDMEQRHGRIIRQGNTNSKVDIYRYTTDKTFDAYLYQMLENKQRFISQIMTDKSPVRSCEDVDEVALDYAEVKALCAGNPLIREKIDLETAITKLNVLKSAFLSQKYSLQDKAYKSLPEHRKYTEHYIEKLKADIETVKSVKPLTNEDGKGQSMPFARPYSMGLSRVKVG